MENIRNIKILKDIEDKINNMTNEELKVYLENYGVIFTKEEIEEEYMCDCNNLRYYQEKSTGLIWELVYISNRSVVLENYYTTYEITYEDFKNNFDVLYQII